MDDRRLFKLLTTGGTLVHGLQTAWLELVTFKSKFLHATSCASAGFYTPEATKFVKAYHSIGQSQFHKVFDFGVNWKGIM